MKKIYSAPEFKYVKLNISIDVLALSDPEPSLPSGGNNPTPTEGIGDDI